MVSSIVAHWRACKGPIHPADNHLAPEMRTIFNLDYPPPAFVGDVEKAPVILLNGNGAYDPGITPAEFPNEEAVERALNRLHHPGPVEPAEVSPYYALRNYAHWLRSGQMALANAVAYRSERITTLVRRVAKRLPSFKVHQLWLWNEVFLAAGRGERLVIAHRSGLWKLRIADVPSGVHFTAAPISPDLPRATCELIHEFLARR